MAQVRILSDETLFTIEKRLRSAYANFERHYTGWCKERQPIHVLYGGAQLYRADTVRKLGQIALQSMEEFSPDAVSFGKALGMDGKCDANMIDAVYTRVKEKLIREPIEDLRIDFEDGYGIRQDEEEDHHAKEAAHELARAAKAKELPPFIGIRIKPFNREFYSRSVRTLDIFFCELASKLPEGIPKAFRIALPKVAIREEAETLAAVCSLLERALKLPPKLLRIELVIERTQAVLGAGGAINVLSLTEAADGRCNSVHFGPYDYAASRNLMTPQPLTHFVSNFAREMVQTAIAGTSVYLADGPTTTLPIVQHPKKYILSEQEKCENAQAIHSAWKLHFNHVCHALNQGCYQGWDLHPAQLPVRYAATYFFFLEKLDLVAKRLKHFVEVAAQATRLGQVFDDIATAQGLIHFISQAIRCGAIASDEVERLTGLSLVEIQEGSFQKILLRR